MDCLKPNVFYNEFLTKKFQEARRFASSRCFTNKNKKELKSIISTLNLNV